MNPSEKLKIFLTNCRGLKQAAGELRQRVNEFRPHLIMLDECHLSSKDSIQGLLPPGYKVIVRLDRTRKGGGQIIAGLSHLLIDKLDLAAYNIKAKVELIGVNLNGKLHVLAYTPKSSVALLLRPALKLSWTVPMTISVFMETSMSTMRIGSAQSVQMLVALRLLICVLRLV